MRRGSFQLDKITNSMKKTIDETNRRRKIQILFNKKNGVTPQPITKSLDNALSKKSIINDFDFLDKLNQKEIGLENISRKELEKQIRITKKQMEKAAKELDFIEAARLRDQINFLKSHY